MRKLILCALFVAATVLMGLALAGKPENPGKDKGNQGCTLSDGSQFKNPGKMFQYLRDREDGLNPAQVAEKYNFESVGDLIAQKCR